MNTFRVWLRPFGDALSVRVDGSRNALWLLDRIGRSFAFKTAAPIYEDEESSCCTFQLAYNSQMSRRGFEKLLAAIPEVNLMSGAA